MTDYTPPTALQSSILNSTNTYRTQHAAPLLSWNTTLSDFANTHVQPCKFAHSGGPYGENLAQGFPSVSAAVDSWAAERAQYKFGNQDDGSSFSEATGHFTQLVWMGTSSIGCAAKDCSSSSSRKRDENGNELPPSNHRRDSEAGWLLMCEYFPRGNTISPTGGSFAANVHTQVNSDSAPSGPTTAATALPSATATQSGTKGPQTAVPSSAASLQRRGKGEMVVVVLMVVMVAGQLMW